MWDGDWKYFFANMNVKIWIRIILPRNEIQKIIFSNNRALFCTNQMFTRTKTKNSLTSRMALANADEWTGEGGVEGIAVEL